LEKSVAHYHKVFIAFAIEDKSNRDHLVWQAQNNRTSFTFTDMSVQEPFSEKWKTQCRERIKGCDGVIALLSSNTRFAEGAKWEMKCAAEERIPIIGVHIYKDAKSVIPSELAGKKVIEWTWDGISEFLRSL
jgi:hypothetical protein